jgi:hypothetical protein
VLLLFFLFCCCTAETCCTGAWHAAITIKDKEVSSALQFECVSYPDFVSIWLSQSVSLQVHDLELRFCVTRPRSVTLHCKRIRGLSRGAEATKTFECLCTFMELIYMELISWSSTRQEGDTPR